MCLSRRPDNPSCPISVSLLHCRRVRHGATTTSALTKGTVRWMAKELFVPGNPSPKHDEKSDIWAFGMVVYVRFFDILHSSRYKVLNAVNG